MVDADRDQRRELHRGVRVLAISWVMAGAIVVGGYLGWWLDVRVTRAYPLLTVTGIALGIAGGGWYAYRAIMKVLNE